MREEGGVTQASEGEGTGRGLKGVVALEKPLSSSSSLSLTLLYLYKKKKRKKERWESDD